MEPVSVIIPTFNRQAMLGRALHSVLEQIEVPCQIIVMDDGSTDGTEAMISHDFPGVEYEKTENRGPSAARNRGLEKARHDWIAFLDSDDQWQPGKLKAQFEFLARHREYLICQTEEIWIRNGMRVNPMKKHQKSGGFIFEKCLPLCIVSPSAVLFHRRLIEEVGVFNESLPACEDYDLWLRIACRYPIGLVEEAFVVKYGGHPDQRSHAFPAMDRFRIQSLVDLLKSGRLNAEQAEAARATLQDKTAIYVSGARKRSKSQEAERVEKLSAGVL